MHTILERSAMYNANKYRMVISQVLLLLVCVSNAVGQQPPPGPPQPPLPGPPRPIGPQAQPPGPQRPPSAPINPQGQPVPPRGQPFPPQGQPVPPRGQPFPPQGQPVPPPQRQPFPPPQGSGPFPGGGFGVFGGGPFVDFWDLQGRKEDPTYLIVASKKVRPGSVYRVIVNLLRSEVPIGVRASVSRDGVEVASAREMLEVGAPHHLLMKVPDTSIPGDYKLRVEGTTNDASGGILFYNETNLIFLPRFLTILIQTNRPVYNRLQTVRFRVLMLTTNLKPYTQPVEITVLDPRGNIMRKWFSAHSNVGAVSLHFTLPSDPVQGHWTIKILAQGQEERKLILVEKYWAARFEVSVLMPMFLLETDQYIRGSVEANYTYLYSPVRGNATIRLSIQQSKYSYNTNTPAYVQEQFVPWFNGSYKFEFAMADLRQLAQKLDGTVVRVEAQIVDNYMDMENSGFASTRITNGTISLRFLGSNSKVFKPGMPFQAYVAVSYHDFVPLSSEKLLSAQLDVAPLLTMRLGGSQTMTRYDTKRITDGVWKIEFDTPFDAAKLDLRVSYADAEGDRVTTSTVAVSYYSQERRFIGIYTTTAHPKIGEYLIFHVRKNFYIQKFNYLILAKGIIVASGTEMLDSVTQSVKTFAIPVSSEMAPSCRIVIYHVTKDGEVLSDSLTIPIDAVARHEISLELNQAKDKLGNTVELRVTGDPGAFYGVSVMDADTYTLQGGNEITPALVMELMHAFDSDYSRLNKVLWTSREGKPDRTAYFTTNNYGVDANRTFDLAGLVVFTDANVSRLPDLCDESLGIFSCMDGTCYRFDQKCNGRADCQNSFDEADCGADINSNNFQDFRLSRRNHIDRFYDPDFGDWAWISFNLAPEGNEMFAIGPVPKRPTTWMVNGISMSREFGLGIISQPFEFEGSRPFFMTMEMPSICTRGEQVGVRVQLFNKQPFETYVLLVLPDSPHYRFVHVEAEGFVNSYRPRTSSGEHHHLIWVLPHDTFTVHIPVVPTHVGKFNISIEAFTHVGRDKVIRQLTVEPDGMLQNLHTSLILDLKNQPLSLKFLDVNITETPIVPYEMWRRYVFESPRARVSVCGDVVGPAFPKMPVTTHVLLRRPDRAAEMQVFNFAANVWTLHYLRLTNQWSLVQAKEAFKHLNVFYAWIQAYMRSDGSFAMWKGFEPSVWLTQYVVRIFQLARFPDWEMYLYIDQTIIRNAVEWVLKYQAPDGSFYESTILPLDRKMDPRGKRGNFSNNARFMNVSLTAQVLITLCDVNDLPGNLRTKVSNAKIMAVQYLERLLSNLDDPYELAVTTYALTRAGSVDAEAGFNLLDKAKREQEGKVYWSREEIPLTRIVMENQRPYMQARLPQKYDSMNVEASAYALLVYILKEGLVQEQIVRWLNSMRTADGGFISTQDTIVAMQALTEYTFRARVRDITDMRVEIDSSANPGHVKTIKINDQNLAQLQEYYLKNVWGHVQVLGRGAGLAVLQMDVDYAIDYSPLIIQPAVKAFDLRVRPRFTGRNSSTLIITSCQRWTYTAESPTSGAAVVEYDIPSGYYQYQPVLDAIVDRENRGVWKQLRRIKIMERKLHVYYNYLDNRETCVTFHVQRWYPVANMTRYMRMRVFDYYAPERYNESIFDVASLYTLSICDVCGSYQCPYCPYFSLATVLRADVLLMTICMVLVWKRWT